MDISVWGRDRWGSYKPKDTVALDQLSGVGPTAWVTVSTRYFTTLYPREVQTQRNWHSFGPQEE